MIRARGTGGTSRLRVAVTDARGRPLAVARPLARWLERHAPRTAHGTVAIALVGDARMRTLNRTFRGVDKATDVLSFPSAEGTGMEAPTFRSARPAHPAGLKTGRSGPAFGPKPRALSPKPYKHLGDLAIATGVAARQARAEGHDFATELRILALHGLLHLLGYDHERDRGTMRALEDRLRRRAGLPAGLITRTPKRPLHR